MRLEFGTAYKRYNDFDDYEHQGLLLKFQQGVPRSDHTHGTM